MREELNNLEQDAQENEAKTKKLELVIGQLEKSIAHYKKEHDELISQALSIKSDLNSVESKAVYKQLAFLLSHSRRLLLKKLKIKYLNLSLYF